jgi:hypothetical protein
MTKKDLLVLLLNIPFVGLIGFLFIRLFFLTGPIYIFQDDQWFVISVLVAATLLTFIILKLSRLYSLKLFLCCFLETVLLLAYLYFYIF